MSHGMGVKLRYILHVTVLIKCYARNESIIGNSLSEIDERFLPFLEYLRQACTDKAEEHEWRKYVIDALEACFYKAPLKYFTFDDLRKKFL